MLSNPENFEHCLPASPLSCKPLCRRGLWRHLGRRLWRCLGQRGPWSRFLLVEELLVVPGPGLHMQGAFQSSQTPALLSSPLPWHGSSLEGKLCRQHYETPSSQSGTPSESVSASDSHMSQHFGSTLLNFYVSPTPHTNLILLAREPNLSAQRESCFPHEGFHSSPQPERSGASCILKPHDCN